VDPLESVTTYELPGDPAAVTSKVFHFNPEGRVVQFGAWSSRPKAGAVTLQDLHDWTRFVDYIMEGVVQYDLRIAEREDSLLIQLRKLGMNRDPHIDGFTEWSFTQLGLEWKRVES
jgi:hypothetical protein